MGNLSSIGFVIRESDGFLLSGLSDIEIVDLSGTQYMLVASEAYGAITVFQLDETGPPTHVSTIEYSGDSGTNTLSDLTLVPTTGGFQVLALGRYDDNYGLYDIDNNGDLSLAAEISDSFGSFERGLISESVRVGPRTFVYAANFGSSGFTGYAANPDGTMTKLEVLEDSDWRALGDVSVIEHVQLHGNNYLVAGAAIDTGLHLFNIRPLGFLTFLDRHVPIDGDGMFAITAIDAAQPEIRGFLIVASAGTDTLTVLRVSEGGKLNQVDHLIDTRDTRFGGVMDIKVFDYDGRSFVVAGGADDGISIFEINHRGQLEHLLTLADDFEYTLQNISSIEVLVIGDKVHIYVGSSSEHGVTEVIVDLTRTGDDIRGDITNDTLIGTSGDDVIWGMGHNDSLFGGAGDDRLIDGRGTDEMTGGAGADIFEFTPDGHSDFILDFEIGIDKIDLTGWDHLYHISSLEIGSRINGAVIIVGDDIIRLRTSEGGPIDVSLLTQDDFIFG